MNWTDVAGQDRAVRILRSALVRDQAHHAYLLAGPAGVGKELLARVFALAANCEAEPPEARPCGVCSHCKAIARGNFPDVMWLMPQAEMVARGLISRADLEAAPSKEIRVDEVRALAKRLSFAALRGRRKVAIVTPAEAINERAQNTLLKTLEEPPPATTFLLLSANPDALLPTIRSRCARVQLGPVPEEVDPEHRPFLEAAERALAAADERDALDVAEQHGERDDALRAALVFQAWTRDLLAAQSGGQLEHRELQALAAEIGQRVRPVALLGQAQVCSEVIEALEQNGNGRLQLERLFLRTRELRNG
ncbi:MAG: DNA polymerase III subunit delta' [Myxococcales bacterium]|nr:DNA polymerase III subunit delta' [Myxococcales bacterium]